MKDKRHAVKSLTNRLHNKFNISAAEVAELEIWQRAIVGVAMVSNDARFTNKALSQVVNFVENDYRVILDDYHIELLAVGEGTVPEFDPTDEALDPVVASWFTETPA